MTPQEYLRRLIGTGLVTRIRPRYLHDRLEDRPLVPFDPNDPTEAEFLGTHPDKVDDVTQRIFAMLTGLENIPDNSDDEDDEEFCPTCFAGTESSQHLTDPRCGATS